MGEIPCERTQRPTGRGHRMVGEDAGAPLGADVGRSSFIVLAFHHLLHAGLPAVEQTQMRIAPLHARCSAPARAWRPLRLPVSGTHGCVRRASERSVYAARADQSGIPAYPGRTGRNTPRHRLLSTGRCSDGPPPPGEPPGGAQAPASPAPDPETKRCNTAILLSARRFRTFPGFSAGRKVFTDRRPLSGSPAGRGRAVARR